MTQKIFLTENKKARVICPECGNTKLMDITRFSHIEKEIKLKITCKCRHVFSVILERRKHVRREVHLSGTLTSGGKKHNIKVIDISRLGLKIRTEEVVDLNLDDRAVIDFILDDTGQSRVSKDVIIKKVDGEYIGVTFISQDHYDKLGTYLLFHFG